MRTRVDISGALTGLQKARRTVLGGVERYGTTAAVNMEQYAKANRPWTDRTGNARRTLEGRFERDVFGRGVYSVAIVGHMPYSVHLELLHGRKYSILYPTVNALAAQTLQGWSEAIRNS